MSVVVAWWWHIMPLVFWEKNCREEESRFLCASYSESHYYFHLNSLWHSSVVDDNNDNDRCGVMHACRISSRKAWNLLSTHSMFLFESSESTIEMSIFVSNFIGEDMWDFWNVSLFYLQGFSFTFWHLYEVFMCFK